MHALTHTPWGGRSCPCVCASEGNGRRVCARVMAGMCAKRECSKQQEQWQSKDHACVLDCTCLTCQGSVQMSGGEASQECACLHMQAYVRVLKATGSLHSLVQSASAADAQPARRRGREGGEQVDDGCVMRDSQDADGSHHKPMPHTHYTTPSPAAAAACKALQVHAQGTPHVDVEGPGQQDEGTEDAFEGGYPTAAHRGWGHPYFFSQNCSS